MDYRDKKTTIFNYLSNVLWYGIFALLIFLIPIKAVCYIILLVGAMFIVTRIRTGFYGIAAFQFLLLFGCYAVFRMNFN